METRRLAPLFWLSKWASKSGSLAVAFVFEGIFISAKALNSTEVAHVEIMSTFAI